MADKITIENELKLMAKFTDNDTRTIPVDDPKDGLTAAQIKAAESQIKTSNAILGDKGGADFYAFESARTITKKTTKLDLG